MANSINQTKWADHLRGCAGMANEIAGILDIRDDAPRQAMFATIVISAVQHHVFLDPTVDELAAAEGRSTPVIPPEAAAVESSATKKGADEAAAEKPTVDEAARKDAQAAEKADAQIQEIVPNPTPEIADGARRTSFLAAITSARELLNKEGHQPPVTPKGLNAYIATQFKNPPKTELGQLDTDELEKLTMLLSSKLDAQREKNNKAKEAEALDFP